MSNLVANTEPTSAKEADLFERVLVATIFEIQQARVVFFILLIFLRGTSLTEHWLSVHLDEAIRLLEHHVVVLFIKTFKALWCVLIHVNILNVHVVSVLYLLHLRWSWLLVSHVHLLIERLQVSLSVDGRWHHARDAELRLDWEIVDVLSWHMLRRQVICRSYKASIVRWYCPCLLIDTFRTLIKVALVIEDRNCRTR